MSKKYFIASDVHSFFTPFKQALDEAGFDINNDEHILIIDGDLFDRGDQTLETLNFVRSLPKEKRILIKGNHEYLLRDLLNKSLPNSYDISNGTMLTVFQLAGLNLQKESPLKMDYEYLKEIIDSMDNYYFSWVTKNDIAYGKKIWKKIVNKVKKTDILNWIFDSGEWKNYFELDNYIFCHAFIPVNKPKGMHMYQPNYESLFEKEDWRTNSSNEEFEQATWGCPYALFDRGLFDSEKEKGKILVCGHWHCFEFKDHYYGTEYWKTRDKTEIDFNIFYSPNLIAIDACTAYSGVCNVLVIEDGKCYQHNKLLEYKTI